MAENLDPNISDGRGVVEFKTGLMSVIKTGKSTLVEHRTFLHLYHRSMWIFLILMFQGLIIIAFNHGKLNLDTFKTLLSIAPTYAILEFLQCCLDVVLIFGAYSTARGTAISRLIIRFFWGALSSVFITYLYVKVMQERNDNTYFRIYLLVVGIYAALRIVFALLLKIPACHSLLDHPFFQWIYEVPFRFEMVHKRFESFPEAFVKLQLVSSQANRMPTDGQSCQSPEENNDKTYSAQFSPFWNEIIKSLREQDYISNREMDLLSMPSNAGSLRLVQWPLFLLSSKISLAIDLAIDCKDTQADLWSRIIKDKYMAYAVQECYYSIEKVLVSLADGEGRLWVERIFREINASIMENSLVMTVHLKKLPLVLSRFSTLTALLIMDETPQLEKGGAKAIYELYEVVTYDLLCLDLSEQIETWSIVARARNEGRLFSNIRWPRDPDIKEQVKRLHLLLKVKDSAANVPKNREARRRLESFTNSLLSKTSY